MEINSNHPFTKKLLETNPVFAKYPIIETGKSRACLPHDSVLTEKNMVWTILKDNIGRDLWSITMPVTFNEPLSLLQRINEHLEFQDLLRTANKCMDQYLRLAYVAGSFFITLSNSVKRVNKTFNPLLGETYEYVDNDLKTVLEQVSHHPPIAAFHSECKDFIVTGHFHLITHLKLTSFKMIASGETLITLKSTGETFTLTKPKTPIYNYMMGKIYLWHEGVLECVNTETKDRVEINFPKKGWTSKGDYLVDGFLYDEDGKEVYKIEGSWKDSLHIVDSKTKEITKIAEKRKEPPNADKQYSFSDFAIQSNFFPVEMLPFLPPTDSRLRPDLRAYEHGDTDLAGKEKFRLEVSQRERRKFLTEKKENWKPLWFDFEMNGSEIKTKYKGEYWKVRETGKWPEDILDLYN